jgi:two-component system chemotaxis response regulator CheY
MRRVLNVGQCGYDHGTIARFLIKGFGADVIGADTPREAIEAIREERFDLVLVNRVSDADGSSGLDLIRSLKADPALAEIPVMLVSNYNDAQEQAEALGALPGFGKADLNKEKAAQRLRAVFRD